jgi:hypothetical protein
MMVVVVGGGGVGVTAQMMVVGVVMVMREESSGIQHHRGFIVRRAFSRTGVSSVWRTQTGMREFLSSTRTVF